MAKAHIYGKIYDRSDTVAVKMSIPLKTLDKAFELAASEDDDAKEDFMDEATDLDYGVFTVLNSIVFNTENDVLKAAKKWKTKGQCGFMAEEFSVGFGHKAADAVVEFAKVE